MLAIKDTVSPLMKKTDLDFSVALSRYFSFMPLWVLIGHEDNKPCNDIIVHVVCNKLLVNVPNELLEQDEDCQFSIIVLLRNITEQALSKEHSSFDWVNNLRAIEEHCQCFTELNHLLNILEDEEKERNNV